MDECRYTISLQQMLKRPNFFVSREKWRQRSVPVNCLEDIYDGQIWKEFLNNEGKPFLSVPFNFALSLNVDWFQPFVSGKTPYMFTMLP